MAYCERWKTYRRRRNLFFLLLLTLWPCVLMTRYAISQRIGDPGLWNFFPVGWSAAALVVGTWTNVLVCPRCGKLFFGVHGRSVVFYSVTASIADFRNSPKIRSSTPSAIARSAATQRRPFAPA